MLPTQGIGTTYYSQAAEEENSKIIQSSERRTATLALYLLAASVGCGTFGAICWTAAPTLAIAAVVAAVAFGVLGSLIALNLLASTRLPPFLANIVHRVHSFCVELIALLPAIALYPATYFFQRTVFPEAADTRPVLLVHGYLHNASAWAYFMYRLKHVFSSVYTVNIRPAFGSIECGEQIVKDKVAQIQKETGQNDVLLVGHSMGGLIANQVALELSLPGVVSIVSPLKGTPAAYAGIGEGAKQMRPDSLFTNSLQQRLKENQTVQCLQIASKPDLIVPGKYALTEPTPCIEQFTVSDLGHLSVLYSPAIVDKTVAWLQRVPKNVTA